MSVNDILSYGDNVRDMKWYAKSTKTENENITSGSN